MFYYWCDYIFRLISLDSLEMSTINDVVYSPSSLMLHFVKPEKESTEGLMSTNGSSQEIHEKFL